MSKKNKQKKLKTEKNTELLDVISTAEQIIGKWVHNDNDNRKIKTDDKNETKEDPNHPHFKYY